MSTPRTARSANGWLLLPLLFALPAFAQSDAAGPNQPPDAGGPGGSVPLQDSVTDQEGAVYGRIRFIDGGVTLKRGNLISSDIVVNDPLTPADVFTTADDGRAEIQLADGSDLKLDFDSELVLQSLSDSSNQIENTTILQLGRGSLLVNADHMDSKEKRFQIDTDGATVFLLSDGAFRIDVRPDGTVVISSRRGVAEVMSQEVSSLVRSGERLTVRPGQIPGEARAFNTRMIDEFDAWSNDRDAMLVRRARVDDEAPAGLPEPVEPYTGELNYYGHWYNNPSYGWIWRPVGLGPDWQPYLYGRWVSCPTGLVWVSYEPWGWAPFHYGRWEFLLGTGWVWIPGHVFSGAYVAWSVAPGYFGWCPLGYYDYPVSFSVDLGFHHDPWVFVGAQNIFVRRVNTVVVRDSTVLHEIDRTRVVMRGHPVVDPRRVREAPRVTEELHSIAQDRRDLRLEPQAPGRRVPFSENERQKLVQLNDRRMRDTYESRGRAVGSTGADRPVNIIPTDRRVNVPRGRDTAAPGQQPYGPGATRGGGRNGNPAPDDGRQKETPRQVGPRSDQQPRGDSLPERVIPRIIPRPGSSGTVGRQEPQDRPSPPRQNVQPGQDRFRPAPGARPQQQRPPQQPQQQPQQQKPRPPENKGDGHGGDKKHKN